MDRHKVRLAAEQSFALMSQLGLATGGDGETRTGIVLTLRHTRDMAFAPSRIQMTVGTVADPDKLSTYECCSDEKARRLAFTHSEMGHVLSFQSANEELGRYQGSALDGDWIASGSGLSAEADEAFVLCWHVKMGLLATDDALELASISENTTFRTIAEHL